MKTAFIGHSYHHKTSSTSFLIALLESLGPVDCLWDDGWKGGPAVDVRAVLRGGYDLIFLVQVLEHAQALSVSGHQNVVFVPMYDGCRLQPDSFWRSCRNLKVISFSSTLNEKLQRLGLASRHFQYFPDPALIGITEGFGTLRGFFWQRTHDITWVQIRQLCAAGSFETFKLHSALDPGGGNFLAPPDEDVESFRIDISNWFDSKREYWRILQRCNVFFAPRPYEGIGLSFLEAMAMGMAVVAPNSPTMNEYITHGVNGYLYDLARPAAIDFSAAKQIGARARETVETGCRNWIDSRENFERVLATSLNELKREQRRNTAASRILSAILPRRRS